MDMDVLVRPTLSIDSSTSDIYSQLARHDLDIKDKLSEISGDISKLLIDCDTATLTSLIKSLSGQLSSYYGYLSGQVSGATLSQVANSVENIYNKVNGLSNYNDTTVKSLIETKYSSLSNQISQIGTGNDDGGVSYDDSELMHNISFLSSTLSAISGKLNDLYGRVSTLEGETAMFNNSPVALSALNFLNGDPYDGNLGNGTTLNGYIFVANKPCYVIIDCFGGTPYDDTGFAEPSYSLLRVYGERAIVDNDHGFKIIPGLTKYDNNLYKNLFDRLTLFIDTYSNPNRKRKLDVLLAFSTRADNGASSYTGMSVPRALLPYIYENEHRVVYYDPKALGCNENQCCILTLNSNYKKYNNNPSKANIQIVPIGVSDGFSYILRKFVYERITNFFSDETSSIPDAREQICAAHPNFSAYFQSLSDANYNALQFNGFSLSYITSGTAYQNILMNWFDLNMRT